MCRGYSFRVVFPERHVWIFSSTRKTSFKLSTNSFSACQPQVFFLGWDPLTFKLRVKWPNMTHTLRALETIRVQFQPTRHPPFNGPAQGQLGTGPNKAERAKEREAILRQMEVGGSIPGVRQDDIWKFRSNNNWSKNLWSAEFLYELEFMNDWGLAKHL